MTDYTFYLEPDGGADFDLTETQKQVASLSADSRAVVYGSPGSGKTEALTALFLRLISGGEVKPSQVLALAASREAANLLRDRLAISYQGATAGPMARTLSSFAFQILRQHALVKGVKAPELISGSEQDRILKQIVATLDESTLKAQGWPQHINSKVVTLKGFRSEVRDLITVCQEYRVDPAELRALGQENSRADWVAAAHLLEAYLTQLRLPEMENRHDSSTLLDVAADLLESGEGFTEDIRAIRTVLVDDAQELTPSARRLLKVLVSSGAGLVLFGDPDTSTLGFRSADARSMSTMMQELGFADKAIYLKIAEGKRKPELAAALGNISALLPAELSGLQRRDYATSRTELSGSQVVEAHLFANSVSEIAWLGRRLRQLHLTEEPRLKWSEIAIVARSRVTLEALAAGLASEEVPVAIRGSRLALRDEFASGQLLKILGHVISEEPMVLADVRALLASPFCGLDSLGLRRLRRALRRQELEGGGQRTSDELLAALFASPGSTVTVDSTEGRLVNRFVKTYFDAIEKERAGASAEELLWHFWASGKDSQAPRTIWKELSTQADEIGAQMNRNLDAIVALFSAAKRFVERNPGVPARVFIEEQLSLELPEDSLGLNYRDDDRVALMTPSGLIGKRFKAIILPRLQDGLWPNLKPRNSLLGARRLDAIKSGRAEKSDDVDRNEIDDELRMLHKAVGAADEKLIITAIDAEEEQASSFIRTLLTKIPEEITEFKQSRLTLRGLVGDLRRRLVTTSNSHERISFAFALARLALEEEPGASPRDWFGLLEISSFEPLVSATAEPSEKVHLRPSHLDDFIKCPLHWFLENHGGSDRNFEASLGTLLHEVLEQEGDRTDEELWKIVEDRWQELEFEAEWMSEKEKKRARRMFGAMTQYLHDSSAQGNKVLGREFEFKFEFEGAVINGKVDRIEQTPTGSVVIVDLKTGKSISDALAQEHPQLGVYQLAVEHEGFLELGLGSELKLDGAKLVFVGEANGEPKERTQEARANNPELHAKITEQVSEAIKGMAMPELVLRAKSASHCTKDYSYGTCELHLVPAVSYVG